ncbi:uncharacterized protein LOC122015674 [Zingiber officinale]|uniref:uncharacterized protein LOC122015674 n=1 Tax=Zingiber officinale TaxID=94328 RepID=UPI001C4AA4C0|nr:uncharacterized protein LOC122015674 [Zingiber officinale]
MACCRSMIQGSLLLNPIPSVVPKGNLPSRVGRHRSGARIIKCCLFSMRDFRPQLDEYPEGIISGEWTENFSLLSFDDLRAYLESQVPVDKGQQPWLLGEVMSKTILTTTVDRKLDEVNHHFDVISALPVVDDQLRCIGVISKSDIAKASQGARTKVGEVMSSPAITLSTEKTVMDAAALMLKMKIHRIPVVNKGGKVTGIVTRTDIWEALEAMEQ